MISKIYLNSPRVIQNIALSAYGFYTYKQRFGKAIADEFKASDSPFQFEEVLVDKYHHERLQLLVNYSYKFVPYYRKLFASLSIQPQDITLENYSQLIPILTKQELIKHQQEFYSNEPRKDFLWLNTSGTSGSPMRIKADTMARQINYYFYNQLLTKLGSDYRHRSTTFAGRILFNNKSSKYDRYDFFNNTQYLSSYFISADTCKNYIDALNSWRPEFIDSYPSAIFELQRLARLKNVRLEFKPKFILTSSETLSTKNKNAIEEYFNCNIVDHYGCTEMAISAYSNGSKYYINPYQSFVELVKNIDNIFSVVTTGLINFSMPLLRYEIGDNIICDEPSNPYVFNSVLGRADDVIVTPEGKMIGRLCEIIYQHAPQSLKVATVP